MEIGAALPVTEIGGDLGAIREFAQASEDLGYTHLRILDTCLARTPGIIQGSRHSLTPTKV